MHFENCSLLFHSNDETERERERVGISLSPFFIFFVDKGAIVMEISLVGFFFSISLKGHFRQMGPEKSRARDDDGACARLVILTHLYSKVSE